MNMRKTLVVFLLGLGSGGSVWASDSRDSLKNQVHAKFEQFKKQATMKDLEEFKAVLERVIVTPSEPLQRKGSSESLRAPVAAHAVPVGKDVQANVKKLEEMVKRYVDAGNEHMIDACMEALMAMDGKTAQGGK